MAYDVRFSKRAQKAYNKLPGDIKVRIDQKLLYLQLTPRGSDTKKLVGEQNTYRTRVGSYRLVYEIDDETVIVWIVDVGHRGAIYR